MKIKLCQLCNNYFFYNNFLLPLLSRYDKKKYDITIVFSNYENYEDEKFSLDSSFKFHFIKIARSWNILIHLITFYKIFNFMLWSDNFFYDYYRIVNGF